MEQEAINDLTDSLVKAASIVLERFQAGYHPSNGELDLLERALFPFVSEKICGHKIVEDCECFAFEERL